MVHWKGDNNYPHAVKYAVSSIAAGTVTTVAMQPIWTIRTRLVVRLTCFE